MPVPTFGGLPPYPTFEDIADKVNKLVNELRNLLLNLDTLNVSQLSADVINAGTINAGLVKIRSDLNDGAFIQIDGNGMKINNGTFDTFIADIEGAVTMTSALIQSATGYPKVVMDPATELFGAYTTAAKFINILANDAGDPLLYFENATNTARVALLNDLLSIGAFGKLLLAATGNMSIETTGAASNINIKPGSGGQVVVPSWAALFSTADLKTLQQSLNAKATAAVATGSGGSANGGIPIGTVLMVSGGGTVTWNGIPPHTHPQT